MLLSAIAGLVMCPANIQGTQLWLSIELRTSSGKASALEALAGEVVLNSTPKLIEIVLAAGSDPRKTVASVRKIPSVKSVEVQLPRWTKDPLTTESLKEIKRLRAEYIANYGVYELFAKAELDNHGGAKETPGLDYIDAYIYFHEERAYPYDEVNWGAYATASQHRDQMDEFGGIGPAGLSGTWSYLGPTNLDTPYRIYYGLPPLNGRINAVSYHPTDSNTVYLASAQGGVWKTTNGGTNWSPLTDSWEILHTSGITVDPSSGSTIYVGTGDFPGNKSASMGIMKSVDAGATWTNLGRAQFGNVPVAEVLVVPSSPQTIIAATGRRSGMNGLIWRSTDGGATWTAPFSGTSAAWSDLAVSEPNAGTRTIYAAGGDSSGGELWRSTNEGATWTKLNPPLGTGSNSVLYVATSPTFPGNVYLLSPSLSSIFKSTDFGNTWSNITAGFPTGYIWSQGSYNNQITCSKRTSGATTYDVVYVGLIDLVQSRDSGATWQSVGGPTYSSSSSILHNDQHCMAIDPNNPDKAMVGGDGGIYRFNYTPSTNTWNYNYLSRNLGTVQFYKAAYHPTNADVLLGGTQDNATPFTNGNLTTWDNVGGGDGGFCAINPFNPNEQYATSQYLNVYRTGNSWSSSNGVSPNVGSDSVAFIAPIVLDPNNGDLLYAGTNYLYRRNDATGSWASRLGGQSLSVAGNVRFIAIAQGDGQRIYTGSNNGELWMTQNGGTSWTQINGGSSSLPNRSITWISVNPTNKNDVLVGLSGTGTGHLYRCLNPTSGSRVWTDVSGSGANGLPDISLNAIAHDPWKPDTVWYVGTDVGVLATVDAGATWQNMTAPLGLPNVQVNDLRAVQGSGYLYAATYGRGMWRIPISQNVLIRGSVELQDWDATTAGQSVTLQIRSTGSTTPVQTLNTILDGSGNYSFMTSHLGTYDVSCKAPNWLRKVRSSVVITASGANNVNFSLVNGDAEEDNEVNLLDFASISAAFGSSPGDPQWNARADLNGDLEVNLADLGIVSANFGDIGDE